MSAIIYADYNATTPILPEVTSCIHELQQETWANPSAAHQLGRKARGALETARRQLAKLLGVEAERLLFTSGGSEANNWVLTRARCEGKSRYLVVSSVEHPSVLVPARKSIREGDRLSVIGVDSKGCLDMDAYHRSLNESPNLVSIMGANNEIGNIYPIRELAELAHDKGALFHCDASQCIGKHDVDFQSLGVDFLTISAHKFYGPKGVGALLVRDRQLLESFGFGGGQEFGLRPGTENLASICGMTEALRLLQEPSYKQKLDNIGRLRDSFESQLQEKLSGVHINGNVEAAGGRLKNTSNIRFDGVCNHTLLMNLDLAGICCSAGSACSSGSLKPSSTLLALGLSDTEVSESLRFSFGLYTTAEEIDKMVDAIVTSVPKVRKTAKTS